ncbi:MAG: hypothetical protein G01um101425_496 [Candidatus Peregrinibacteria bacterium Gr01-1014_25]|nr:MAG: hypothetical protein G01um101425_496 [Candidatus Peregrinibacteria bacterium Gr01-1014_25]
MQRLNTCVTTILKPYPTSHEAFFAQLAGEDRYDEVLDEWAEDVRGCLEETAERLRVLLRVDEVELRRLPSEGGERNGADVLSRKRSADVQNSDVVIAVDPPPIVLTFVNACLDRNPIMRGVVAAAKGERIDRIASVLKSRLVPDILRPDRALPRLYAIAGDRREMLQSVIERVLRFPHGSQVNYKPRKNVIHELTEMERDPEVIEEEFRS